MMNKKQAIGLGFITILFIALLGLTAGQPANARNHAFEGLVAGAAVGGVVGGGRGAAAGAVTGTVVGAAIDAEERDYDYRPRYRRLRYRYAPDYDDDIVSVDADYYPNDYFSR